MPRPRMLWNRHARSMAHCVRTSARWRRCDQALTTDTAVFLSEATSCPPKQCGPVASAICRHRQDVNILGHVRHASTVHPAGNLSYREIPVSPWETGFALGTQLKELHGSLLGFMYLEMLGGHCPRTRRGSRYSPPASRN